MNREIERRCQELDQTSDSRQYYKNFCRQINHENLDEHNIFLAIKEYKKTIRFRREERKSQVRIKRNEKREELRDRQNISYWSSCYPGPSRHCYLKKDTYQVYDLRDSNNSLYPFSRCSNRIILHSHTEQKANIIEKTMIKFQLNSFLDVGCAEAAIDLYLLQKHIDWKIIGIDIADNMDDYLPKINNFEFHQLDVMELSVNSEKIKDIEYLQSSNLIVFFDIFQHILMSIGEDKSLEFIYNITKKLCIVEIPYQGDISLPQSLPKNLSILAVVDWFQDWISTKFDVLEIIKLDYSHNGRDASNFNSYAYVLTKKEII